MFTSFLYLSGNFFGPKNPRLFTFYKGFKNLVHVSWDFFSPSYGNSGRWSIAINQIYHCNGKMSFLLPVSLQRRPDLSHQESCLYQIINVFLDIIRFCNLISSTLLLTSQISMTAGTITTDLPTTRGCSATVIPVVQNYPSPTIVLPIKPQKYSSTE